MNKLSQCELYNAYKELRPDIIKMLNPQTFALYEIPSTFYENWFNPLSAKKYPLVRPTLKAAKAGRIHLFNLADPIDEGTKKVILHPSYSVGLGLNAKKELVSYVNAADKTGYIRNSAKEAVGLKVDENHLYGYLQSGFLGILLATKDAEITNNVKLQVDMAEVYATLLSAVIDKIYPISSELDAYPRLVFLCSLFYLQFMAGMPEEKAVTLALKVKTVDPIVVGNKSRALNQQVLKMTSYNDFLHCMQVEFPFINPKDLSIRAIADGFRQKCGPASFFAVEHFQTLLNLTMHVALRTNLYNDFNLSKMLNKALLDDIAKLLLIISGE